MSLGMAYVAFHLRSSEILQDKDKVLPVLKAILDSGWKLRKPTRLGSTEEFIASPDEVAAAWEEATTLDQLGATVAFYNQNGFEVKLGIDYSLHWQKLLLLVRGSDVAIEYSDHAATNRQALLEVCELVYAILYPVYGYGVVFTDQLPLAEYAYTSSTVYAVYDLNFLGSKLVEQYGREQLLSLPVYRKTEFKDGGILIAIAPYLGYPEKQDSYEAVARVLGVKTIRR
jgi:hypothetical protein